MMAIWRPGAAQVAAAHLTQFMQGLARSRGPVVSDYAALHAWSVAEPEAFWRELAGYAGVLADWGTGPILADPQMMPGGALLSRHET